MTTLTSPADVPQSTFPAGQRAPGLWCHRTGPQSHRPGDRSAARPGRPVRRGARGPRCTPRFVLDTHTHPNHLSGVRRLARRTGATVLARPGSKWRAGAADQGRRERRAQHDDGGDRGRPGPHPTPSRCSWRPPLHGRRPVRQGRGPDRLHGGQLRRPVRHAARLRAPARHHGGPSRSRLCRAGRDHDRRGKAGNPLLREPDRAAFVARLSTKSAPPANMAAILRPISGSGGGHAQCRGAAGTFGSRAPGPCSSTCEARSSSRASASRAH